MDYLYIVAQQVIGTERNFLKIIDAVGIAAIDLAVACLLYTSDAADE